MDHHLVSGGKDGMAFFAKAIEERFHGIGGAEKFRGALRAHGSEAGDDDASLVTGGSRRRGYGDETVDFGIALIGPAFGNVDAGLTGAPVANDDVLGSRIVVQIGRASARERPQT